jgi:hypothetical protein
LKTFQNERDGVMGSYDPKAWPEDTDTDVQSVNAYVDKAFGIGGPAEKFVRRGRHGKKDNGEFVGRKLISALMIGALTDDEPIEVVEDEEVMGHGG